MCTQFSSENLKERDSSEDLSVDGRIILECILGKRVDVEWILLAWDRDQWPVVVNTEIMLRVPLKNREFLD
jgi:hypothetical protein